MLDKHAEDQPGRSSIPAREDGDNVVDELLAVVRDDYTVIHMSMKEVSRCCTQDPAIPEGYSELETGVRFSQLPPCRSPDTITGGAAAFDLL